jgi:hypothetical protein
VNKPQTIEGVWWIHGKDKPAYFGIVSYDPEKGLELNVKVPQSRTNDEAIFACCVAEMKKWLRTFKGQMKVQIQSHFLDAAYRVFQKGLAWTITASMFLRQFSTAIMKHGTRRCFLRLV